jgi:hypothetical protein
MDIQADGYFLNPEPATTPPSPTAHLSAFDAWHAAGLDAYTATIRGGTHLEMAQIPYILPSTTYGVDLTDYYTLAWFDRYLSPLGSRQKIGSVALYDGPVPDRATSGVDELPWRADFLSARFFSAYSFHDQRDALHDAFDIRATSGLSPVGDWAGANADRPAVRPPG